MVKCLNIGKNIGKVIYRSISSQIDSVLKHNELSTSAFPFQGSILNDGIRYMIFYKTFLRFVVWASPY